MKKKTVTRLESSYLQQYDMYIERQKRKKQRLIRRVVLFLIVTFLAFGSLATYHIKQRVVLAEKQEQYEQLEEQLVSLKEEEAGLIEDIDLFSDVVYVLEIARTEYFFSKKVDCNLK